MKIIIRADSEQMAIESVRAVYIALRTKDRLDCVIRIDGRNYSIRSNSGESVTVWPYDYNE